MEATKIIPAPLDAFETAKPDEPIWGVQGGDPLGGPLLRIWSHFARIQADTFPPKGLEGIFEELLKAANNNRPDNDKDRDGLRIRATETEQISWAMDDYRKGLSAEEIVEIRKQTEFDKLDIYDLRRRFASFISGFFSEFNDYRLELIAREYQSEGDFIDKVMLRSIEDLRYIRSTVEIKRGK